MSDRIDGLGAAPGDGADLVVGFDLGGLRIGAEISRGMRLRAARSRAEGAG